MESRMPVPKAPTGNTYHKPITFGNKIIPFNALKVIGVYLDFENQSQLFLWTSGSLRRMGDSLDTWTDWTNREIEQLHSSGGEGPIINILRHPAIPIDSAFKIARGLSHQSRDDGSSAYRAFEGISQRKDLPVNPLIKKANGFSTEEHQQAVLAGVVKRSDISLHRKIEIANTIINKSLQATVFATIMGQSNTLEDVNKVVLALKPKDNDFQDRVFIDTVEKLSYGSCNIPRDVIVHVIKHIKNPESQGSCLETTREFIGLELDQTLQIVKTINDQAIQDTLLEQIPKKYALLADIETTIQSVNRVNDPESRNLLLSAIAKQFPELLANIEKATADHLYKKDSDEMASRVFTVVNDYDAQFKSVFLLEVLKRPEVISDFYQALSLAKKIPLPEFRVSALIIIKDQTKVSDGDRKILGEMIQEAQKEIYQSHFKQ